MLSLVGFNSSYFRRLLFVFACCYYLVGLRLAVCLVVFCVFVVPKLFCAIGLFAVWFCGLF